MTFLPETCIYTNISKVSFIQYCVEFRLDCKIGVQFCKSNQTLNIGSAQNFSWKCFSLSSSSPERVKIICMIWIWLSGIFKIRTAVKLFQSFLTILNFENWELSHPILKELRARENEWAFVAELRIRTLILVWVSLIILSSGEKWHHKSDLADLCSCGFQMDFVSPPYHSDGRVYNKTWWIISFSNRISPRRVHTDFAAEESNTMWRTSRHRTQFSRNPC